MHVIVYVHDIGFGAGGCAVSRSQRVSTGTSSRFALHLMSLFWWLFNIFIRDIRWANSGDFQFLRYGNVLSHSTIRGAAPGRVRCAGDPGVGAAGAAVDAAWTGDRCSARAAKDGGATRDREGRAGRREGALREGPSLGEGGAAIGRNGQTETHSYCDSQCIVHLFKDIDSLVFKEICSYILFCLYLIRFY